MANDIGFKQQIGKTLQWEGGYVNDPNDPGGETKYGISRASYPSIDIAGLTIEAATAIYKRDYWINPGWYELPPNIGAKCFDLGVNIGPLTATKLLQRAVNNMGIAPPLAVDGVLGPQTVGKVNSVANAALLTELRHEAVQHYNELASAHPGLRRYLHGWMRRALA